MRLPQRSDMHDDKFHPRRRLHSTTTTRFDRHSVYGRRFTASSRLAVSASLPRATQIPQAIVWVPVQNSTPFALSASVKSFTVDNFGSDCPCSMAFRTLNDTPAA
jgi:hypothetical protein